MKRSIGLTIMLSILSCLSIAQEVYKSVDKDGNVIFSDSPGPDGKKVDTELKNLHAPIKTSNSAHRSPANTTARPYRLKLLSPAADQQFGPTMNTINIKTAIEGSLRDNHRIAFYLNGQQVASSRSTSTSLNVSRKMRGRNSIAAAIVDVNGETIESTASVSVYVIRPN